MDYIIETHIMNDCKTSFRTRVFKYNNFEEYVNRLKNNESFRITDMFDRSSGYSIPRDSTIKVIKRDLGIFIFEFKLYNNKEVTVYLQVTNHVDIKNINRRIK